MMMKTTLLVSMAGAMLAGCVVGDDTGNVDDSTDVIEARGNPANTLRWRSLSSPCVSGQHGYTTSGGSLSVFFDSTSWKSCTTSGVLVVPAGVRITGVHQFVRGDGDESIIYRSSVNGTRITSRTFTASTGLESYPSVSQIGATICSRAGTAARTVSFSFTIAQVPGIATADSVDWEVQAEHCEE